MSTGGVKSRIADYEAQNQEMKRSSFGSSRTATGGAGTTATPTSSVVSAGGGGGGGSTTSVGGSSYDDTHSNHMTNKKDHHQHQHQHQTAVRMLHQTSTTAASQSRKSRIRQQLARDSKPHHATNLMEKRKQIKERRLLQQKRLEEKIGEGEEGPPEEEMLHDDNDIEYAPNESNVAKRLDYAKKMGYRSNGPLNDGYGPSNSNRSADHYHGKVTPVVTPTTDDAQQHYNARYGEDGSHPSEESQASSDGNSPFRKGAGQRMSKMQRMQKMKGYDHVKRGHHQTEVPSTAPSVTQSSVAAPPSSVAPSTADTSTTTAVARNVGITPTNMKRRQQKYQQHQQHQQQQYVKPRVAPAPVSAPAALSPPHSPVGKIPLEPSGAHLSPGINEHFSHLHSSPRSGTDIMSDANFSHHPRADASMDPVTDDDVTLTSVRRIMASKNHATNASLPGSPSNHSHQYQPLMTHRKNAENNGAKSRNRLQESGLRSRDDFHRQHGTGGGSGAFSSNTSYTRNRLNQGIDIYRDNNGRKHQGQGWLDEEKSDKASGDVFRTASSSDYDTDGDISKTSKASRQSNNLEGPSQSQGTDVNEFFSRSRYAHHGRRTDDDDRTFDYGDRDDDSNGSASYATRRRREAERRAREAANSERKDPSPKGPELPLINKDDVEHYTKSLDTPVMKVGAGVVGAATLGCIVLGPVGLLVGAAAVGIGVGVMQIPEEQRNTMQDRARKTFQDIHDKAVDASENLSHSCLATYKDSGVAEHLPPCLSGDTTTKDHESTHSEKKRVLTDGGSVKSGKQPSTPNQVDGLSQTPTSQNSGRLRSKKVACFRNGKFQ